MTGGAGFLGSHLCDYLLGQRRPRHLRRQPRDRLAAERRAPPRRLFRLPQPRPDASTSRSRSRSTSSSISPARRARSTTCAAAAADAEGRLVRHAQRARRSRSSSGRASCSPRRARCTATRHPPAARDLLGERQPDRPARRLRRGEALRRGADDGLPPASRASTRASSASSTPTAPRMRPHDGRAIPTFVRQALAGEPLTVFGDGSQTRSFCYVDDLVRGLSCSRRAASTCRSTSATRRSSRCSSWPQTVLRVTGSTSEIVFEALPVDDPQVRQPDITRARQLLGWEPADRPRGRAAARLLKRTQHGSSLECLVASPRSALLRVLAWLAVVGSLRRRRRARLASTLVMPRRHLRRGATRSTATRPSTFPVLRRCTSRCCGVNLYWGGTVGVARSQPDATRPTRTTRPTTGRSTTAPCATPTQYEHQGRLLDPRARPAGRTAAQGRTRRADDDHDDLRNFALRRRDALQRHAAGWRIRAAPPLARRARVDWRGTSRTTRSASRRSTSASRASG